MVTLRPGYLPLVPWIQGPLLVCACSLLGSPDAQLNPKKKLLEQVLPDLHTNEEGVACYKDAPFTVAGKGVCRSQTMKGTGIK